MKVDLRVAAATLCCLFVFAGSALAAASPGPSMVLEETVYHFQEAVEGEVVHHTFQVTNQGGKTLDIREIKLDCGCASAEYDRSIAPGQSGRITIRVDTQGYESKIRRSARIYTNDPQSNPQIIRIEGTVKTPIHLSRRHVVFKGLEREKITKSIEIRAEDGRPLKLRAGRFDLGDKVDYRIEEVEAGSMYRIHFSNIPGPAGRFHGLFTLETNYAEKPELTIRIRGRFTKLGKKS